MAITNPSLEKWNRERLAAYKEKNKDKHLLNGIACPNCGQELYDANKIEKYGPLDKVVVVCLNPSCSTQFTGTRFL